MIVEAMNLRSRRCRRNCGPPGLIASTIAGALCCALFCWLAVDRGMPFSIARRWCSSVLVVTLQERIFSLMRLSRCLHFDVLCELGTCRSFVATTRSASRA